MKKSLLLLAFATGCALYTADTVRAEAEAAAPAADASAKPADSEQATEPAKQDGEKTDAQASNEAKPAEGTQNQEQNKDQSQAGGNAATDVTASLRKKVQQIDIGLASISKPSRYLVSSCTRVKQHAEKELKELDELASKVTSLTEMFNNAQTGEFPFTEVTDEDRDKYQRDAMAAYNAMLTDMKERKGRRKVAGLDKFEIMRERYQGIEEYKKAYEIYIKTLKQLEKHWDKMLAKEEKRRARYNEKRRQSLDAADNEQYEELAAYFKKDGEDIAKVWYNPIPTNLRMLQNCCNKLKDALRRSDFNKMEPEVGKVPQMIQQYWEMMDQARQHMINGEFDTARKVMRESEVNREIARLRSYLLPNEYRDPMAAQYRELENEISKRERARNNEKRDLDRAVSAMERKQRSLESRLVSILESIEEEKARDVGHDSAVMLSDSQEEQSESQDGGDAAKPEGSEGDGGADGDDGGEEDKASADGDQSADGTQTDRSGDAPASETTGSEQQPAK